VVLLTYLLLVTTFASLVLTVLAFLGLFKKLPRNSWAGIRTSFTMKSDENWELTHYYGAPFLIFAGMAASAAGMAFVPFALADKVGDSLLTGVIIAQGVVLVIGAIASWLYGTSRARKFASA